jgi:lipid-A-disaccharide synthase-like uncharacterized protein
MEFSFVMDLFGTTGLVLLLIAFIINHQKIKRKEILFNILNFFGSLILTIYAHYIQSNVFMILNGIWAIISAYYVAGMILKK